MNRSIIIGIISIALLSGCGGQAANNAPLPTVSLDSGPQPQATAVSVESPAPENPAPASESQNPDHKQATGGVTASGIIISAQSAQFVATSSQAVQTVNITVGEAVKSGDVLVVLSGREQMKAAVEAARLELLTAQQELDAVYRDADKARSAALVRLADARKHLDDAIKRREYRNQRNGSESTINAAKADYILAKDYYEKAKDAYGYVEDLSDDNINKAGALTALSAAQKSYDKAAANLNYLTGMPSKLDVDQAEANLQAAKAEVANAEKAFERVKNGADTETVTLAQARVSNAEAQLQANQTSLDEMEIKAPFDGSIGRLSVQTGDWVTPGQVILAMVNLNQLQVETTDLSERDVPKVMVGEPVSVSIKALDINVSGAVSEIAPMADSLGGDVVYKTIISLDEIPQGALPGMSVDVSYE